MSFTLLSSVFSSSQLVRLPFVLVYICFVSAYFVNDRSSLTCILCHMQLGKLCLIIREIVREIEKEADITSELFCYRTSCVCWWYSQVLSLCKNTLARRDWGGGGRGGGEEEEGIAANTVSDCFP